MVACTSSACVEAVFLFTRGWLKALTLEVGWRRRPTGPSPCSPGAETWKKGEKGPLEPRAPRASELPGPADLGDLPHPVSSPCLRVPGPRPAWTSLRHLKHSRSKGADSGMAPLCTQVQGSGLGPQPCQELARPLSLLGTVPGPLAAFEPTPPLLPTPSATAWATPLPWPYHTH